MSEEHKPQTAGKKSKPKAEAKPVGRPVEPVPQDRVEEIIEWVSEGKPLREYCRQEGKPPFRTVYNWLEKDKEFMARFAHARDLGEDVIAQECLEIADDGTNDWMETYDKDGDAIGWKLNGEHVQRSKLRIETRLKLLAKWNPKKYGDRTTLAGDPDNPLMEPMDDTQRAAKLQAILAAAKARKGGDDD